jgi:hypothetical protein
VLARQQRMERWLLQEGFAKAGLSNTAKASKPLAEDEICRLASDAKNECRFHTRNFYLLMVRWHNSV